MTEFLLPASVSDERFARLEQVMVDRLAGIDLTVLLVYLFDSVNASALPSLGWQFGAVDELWNAATDAERRALLQRVLARRRRRGTPWAVGDALSALGYAEFLTRRRPARVADGTLFADGTFAASDRNNFVAWLVLSLNEFVSAEERIRLASAISGWKQASVHLDADGFLLYYVDAPELLSSLPNYETPNTVPVPVEATVDGSELHIEFSRRLDASILPDVGDFVVTGAAASPAGVASISGKVLTVPLDAVLPEQMASVSYVGSSPRMQSFRGSEVPDWGALPILVGNLEVTEFPDLFFETDAFGFVEVS